MLRGCTHSVLLARGSCELGAKTEFPSDMTTIEGKPSWARDLKPIGLNYYGGIVTNIDEVLEEHRRDTQCTFGTRSSKPRKVCGSLSTLCQQAQNTSPVLCLSQQDNKENENPQKV